VGGLLRIRGGVMWLWMCKNMVEGILIRLPYEAASILESILLHFIDRSF
jgi:hypothetical protein